MRWVSILGALVIVAVVAGVIATVSQYTREVGQARDEVRALNADLEARVARRTTDLERARDRAETLLFEVNHRIANSLSIVASLANLQAKAASHPAARDALAEMQARIVAIALVHKRLYTSGDVGAVALDEYLSSLLDNLAASMRIEGGKIAIVRDFAPVSMPTDVAVNIGVVVTEWVTNAFKYAFPNGVGEVSVRLLQLPDARIELSVEDNGVGRTAREPAKGTGLGTRIVNAMATSMQADISYREQPGFAARMVLAQSAA